jgi:hypothetical protein
LYQAEPHGGGAIDKTVLGVEMFWLLALPLVMRCMVVAYRE